MDQTTKMNTTAKTFCRAALAFALLGALSIFNASAETLRPPSVPLVACDPYFSIWSPADKLTDAGTTHWTGKPHHLTSTVQIDGQTFRVMGTEPAETPALTQTGLEVLPTRTIYSFAGAGVELTLTFMTAALPQNIDLLSRPVTYLTYAFQATDGKSHAVSFQFAANGEIAVNTGDQKVLATTEKIGKLTALRIGSQAQPILARKGDDLRIDWGYLYVSANSSQATGSLNVAANTPVPGDTAVATLNFSSFKVGAAPGLGGVIVC
jgi:hypothetical protein